MGLRGVNRVMIAVHDIEKSKLQYSELLGATFRDAHWTGEPFGISVSMLGMPALNCVPLYPVVKRTAPYRNSLHKKAKAS